MTRIYLLRHGFVENPHHVFYGPEFVLSKRGKVQIGEIAEDMKAASVRPEALRHSPFQRTTDSASCFVQALPCPNVLADERLAEWNVSGYFDRPLEEFYAATRYDTPEWHLVAGMETHAQMTERVLAVVTEMRDAYPDQDVVLISHREPIVCTLLALQGRPYTDVHSISCAVASAWEIVFDGQKLISLRQAFDRSEDGHPRTIG